MFTKTGLPPEEIRKILRAENSPRVNCFYEYATGRNKLFESGWYFPMRTDHFGNQYLDADGFSLDGIVTWEVWAQRYFWSRVAKGELGVDPRILFRLPQTEENSSARILREISLQPHRKPEPQTSLKETNLTTSASDVP